MDILLLIIISYILLSYLREGCLFMASKVYLDRLCNYCKESLTRYQVSYSGGRCPKCGFKAEATGTFVDAKEVFYRLLPRSKWWKFWERRQKEYLDWPLCCPYTHKVTQSCKDSYQ